MDEFPAQDFCSSKVPKHNESRASIHCLRRNNVNPKLEFP